MSGLWPPDVGGPASHAPEVCEWLHRRGHDVSVVTFADRAPALEPYAVHWIDRRLPIGLRHAAAAALVTRLARRADVVYSIAILGRTMLATGLSGTPHVIKLTADPAFERALRWGLTDSDMAAFQRRNGMRIAALRALRDLALARASRVLFASRALQELAISWGLPEEKTQLLPNPIEAPTGLGSGENLRRRLGLEGPALVFAGRLVPQKSVEIALEAVHRNDDVTLLVAGDGPERDALERRAHDLRLNGRARFLGPQTRRTVFELLRAADGGVLSSSWENFPHLAIESLSVGTPVVATEVGGVREIVRHDRNGLLVPAGSAEAFGAAIRRYFGEAGLQARLRTRAAESVACFQPRSIYGRLEGVLAGAA